MPLDRLIVSQFVLFLIKSYDFEGESVGSPGNKR